MSGDRHVLLDRPLAVNFVGEVDLLFAKPPPKV